MEKQIEVKLRDGGIYTISKSQIDTWIYLYPEVDVLHELYYLKGQWEANLIPKKSIKNINKFINKYLCKQNASNTNISIEK